ncbi:MAG: hypothetical protein QN183_15570 [Armatimonadota bacterium]|nr:hypothetical protein [Armatimonadota bacterium]MDR7537757.1 hypothetical protein [Armatimonadota bacterium]
MIVPGQRIGLLRLDATVADLRRLFGPGHRWLFLAGAPPTSDAVHDYLMLYWHSVRAAATTLDGQIVASLVILYDAGFPRYRTPDGLDFRTRRAHVLVVYGPPTAENALLPYGMRLIYDQRGIAFRFDGGGFLREINVFRPGRAGRIWHLL